MHLYLFSWHHTTSLASSPPKFDGLNFPIWKVKINLFLISPGVRVAKVITKEFVEPHSDEDTWSEATAKDFKANTKAQCRADAWLVVSGSGEDEASNHQRRLGI